MQEVRPFLKLLAIVFASAIGAMIGIELVDLEPSLPFSFNRTPEVALSPGCNVLGIQVHGMIVSTHAMISPSDTISPADASSTARSHNYAIASDVEDILRYTSTDPNIKALIVDVDSSGGGAEAGTEIAAAIKKFGRPSVSVIHETGASSGYLAAAAADTVFANEESTVGSIGATSSFITQVEKNKKEGYVYEQLSSGPFKDTFSPDKPLTAAERSLIMRDIKISRDNFVQLVAKYRNKPFEAIDALADGSTMLGKQALDAGLIDRFGGTWDAIDYLSEKLGEEASVCWQ